MTCRLKIWVIDHRKDDHQPYGSIIDAWQVDDDAPPGPRYADYCALYGVWGAFTDDPPTYVGFMGYRKYLVLPDMKFPADTVPAHAPGWWKCSLGSFNVFREEYAKNDGAALLSLLAQYDVLVAPPFPLDCSIYEDFARSRSRQDAWMLQRVCTPWDANQIYPYLFMTRWEVFNRAMRDLEAMRVELNDDCTAEDSEDDEYQRRPMAYVMERAWSLWLEHSGLSIHTLPLLHCWEKQP